LLSGVVRAGLVSAGVVWALLAATTEPAAADELRPIIGSLTYPERVVLPETAEVVLELQDGAGFALDEDRFATGGKQVPLAFEVTAPAGPALRLRVAVVAEGALLRLTEPVAIAAGDGPVDLGALRLDPHVPMGFSSTLVCGAVEVEFGFVGDTARLRAGDRVIELRPEPQSEAGAPGARLLAAGEPDTWVHLRGKRALVSLQGQILPECILASALPPLPFRATGNEPAWMLEFDGARMRLARDMGALVEDGPQPLPQAAPATQGDAIAFTADWGRAVLTGGICHDTMTGMPYPYSVEVTAEDTTLTGCGGDPRALLLGRAWRVEAVDGIALPEGAEIGLGFSDSALSLQGPCNRAVGEYLLSGEALDIGPLASTRNACGFGAEEVALRDFLISVNGFDIDAEGALVLRTPDGRLLRARR
jgi:uncharacterized membrane protein